MISFKRYVFAGKRIFQQTLNDTARLRSPIYIIPESYGDRVRLMPLSIALDQFDQPIEQIEPAVNIADHIDAGIFVK